MQLFFYILIIILFFIFIILFFKSFFNYIKYKVPQVCTFDSDFKVMKKYLGKYDLDGKTLVDLGSGTGKVLRFFENDFGVKVTGYEIDYLNVLIAKIFNYILKNKAKIFLGNYLKKDLSNFDVIYVYGFTILMPGIEKKVWKNCKKGTLVISNAFKMPNKKPVEILLDDKGKDEVYIYKV